MNPGSGGGLCHPTGGARTESGRHCARTSRRPPPPSPDRTTGPARPSRHRAGGRTVDAIGTARAAEHDLPHTLGADELVDHRTQDVAETVRDTDVAIDSAGGANWASEYARCSRSSNRALSAVP
ncbi:hypothetical protein [Streptomyces sp. NPDC059894]|uniref:hypothetical protein n=1 Tax=unclassified Streptomyces TaxID=2593676 RepID=UPI003664700E